MTHQRGFIPIIVIIVGVIVLSALGYFLVTGPTAEVSTGTPTPNRDTNETVVNTNTTVTTNTNENANSNTNANTNTTTASTYAHRSLGSDGYCATIEVYQRQSNEGLSWLRLCEDTIESIQEQDKKVVMQTSCGRVFSHDLVSGREEIRDNPGQCVGGLTIIANPTKDWKTYENTRHGYIVKYPSTYTVLGTGDSDSVKILVSKISVDNASSVNVLVSEGVRETFNLDVSDEDREAFQWARGGYSSILPTDFSNKRTVSINGEEFTAVTVEDPDVTRVDYFFVRGSNVIRISDIRIGSVETDNNRIISTFTFTK